MIITTNFYSPTNIYQVSEDGTIDWNNIQKVAERESYATTISPLHTISGLWQERYRTHTSQIWATNFNFTPTGTILNGIELSLSMMRLSRIEDLVIQLCLNGELIGLNKASDVPPDIANMYTADTGIILEPPSDVSIYGSTDDLWGTNLTINDIQDPSFGVVVSLQSHPTIPHRDIGYIDQISLRVSFI